MKDGIKIVTIGGGSSYTPELVEGFIKRYDKLPVRELWLVDIEEGKHKLEIVGELARRMVEKAGIPMKIYTTLNRREALKDADFVTTQLRVGLLEARIKDERIPLSHGMLGQETNGAGGLFKGLRTIPVLLDICKDMDELCNDAWLINFTNPVGMVTEAINRYSNRKKVIGLCNLPIDMHKAIAKILERPTEEVFVTFGGLNHMVFVTGVYVDGEDRMDAVMDKWGSQTVMNIKGTEWYIGFMKELGVIPCSYHRYYYMAKEYLEEAIENYKQNGTRAEKVKKIEEELFELYKDPALKEKPKQLEKRGGSYYSDAACNLICSIYNDTKDIQVVNTVNRGALANLEYEEVAEISCMITKNGPVPISVGKLPKAVNGLIQQIKSFEVAASEAAVTGDYDKTLRAMMINPLVGSQKYAIEVLDELLEAHKDYLPQFHR
ncbi:MAG TPA: 6-phospho-beta-glucosidase [Lachnoclostridium phytofermentans]|uniref:6-phospho-beta-glucosidase n=1 Tax=Lachnoclostridium phytofermentans TaxID=66219 RepID=A0A3D2X7N6_9FIRM|nr:6-phospho-beta-glucosidase [Lachnoclostridium sp.]HCL02555.1 6-phospho-beta-glucosidase [Lachnoclostridium phytofermentans]